MTIVSCIIEYVTNKRTLNLDPAETNSEAQPGHIRWPIKRKLLIEIYTGL